MPSQKRARQRANRQAKRAQIEKVRRRRTGARRVAMLVVVAALIAGLIYLFSPGSSTKKTATTKTTATTTTTAAGDTQAAANAAAVAAGCPSSPSAKLDKPSWSQPPAMTIDPSKHYTATVTTDVGSFTISLDASAAPKTVNNFVFLAEHHFYDCVTFHRVIPGFMDQTGDPTGTGSGGPGYSFADENIPTNGYGAGDVAMANSGPNTNGSQFFVLVGSYSQDNYSLFGHVTSGMDVVQKINADGNANPSANGVPPRIVHRILKITIATS